MMNLSRFPTFWADCWALSKDYLILVFETIVRTYLHYQNLQGSFSAISKPMILQVRTHFAIHFKLHKTCTLLHVLASEIQKQFVNIFGTYHSSKTSDIFVIHRSCWMFWINFHEFLSEFHEILRVILLQTLYSKTMAY